MSEGKNTTILMTAIFLVFIAIAIFILFFKKEKEFKPPDNGGNGNGGNGNGEDPPPGFDIIKLDKITSYSKKIRFELGGSYYATMLSGQVRPGGSVYTNIKIYYSKNGNWTKLGTVGGWPGGTINFAYAINDDCDLIIFEAEQGIGSKRYVDEVHGQLMVEVG